MLSVNATPDLAGAADAKAMSRGLSRRRRHLHPDLQPLASNKTELLDRLAAGEDPERIRSMLWNQLRWWNERAPTTGQTL
jgi:hypothetical protein